MLLNRSQQFINHGHAVVEILFIKGGLILFLVIYYQPKKRIMEKEIFSEGQSLQLIQQMIETAKQEQKDDGYGWIIWDWLLFSASLLTWMNVKFEWFFYIYVLEFIWRHHTCIYFV
jgi:hypothetical protein